MQEGCTAEINNQWYYYIKEEEHKDERIGQMGTSDAYIRAHSISVMIHPHRARFSPRW